MAEYILKKQALNDLENIWHYTAQNWDVQQAGRYTDKLNLAFLTITNNPKMNRERFEFDPPVRIHQHISHIIIYLLSSNQQVTILRILHKSMDIDLNMDEG